MSPLALVILILLVLIAVKYLYDEFRFGYHNTVAMAPTVGTCTTGTCNSEKFNVHREHSDQKAAAALIKEITKRNETFISFLESKYLGERLRSFDPDHQNKIDVIKGTSMYYADNPMEKDVAGKFGKVATREEIQERVQQLIHNYDAKDIHEISPLNKDGSTSYTENKKTLILCLRRKKADENGDHPLHDINTMMFVVLHELTHMMNDEWGHPYEFWVLFKFVLENAVEAGVYTPVDYKRNPLVYCGMDITYNPLFDLKLPDEQ